MVATLELRRYVPQNFAANNPDPEFKILSDKDTWQYWDMSGASNRTWQLNQPYVQISNDSQSFESTFTPTFRTVVIYCVADTTTDSASLNMRVELKNDGTTSLNQEIADGSDVNVIITYYRFAEESDTAITDDVIIDRTDPNAGNATVYGVWFLEEAIQGDDMFDSLTNGWIYDDSNMNLLGESWRDSTGSEYNTASEQIDFFRHAKGGCWRPVFTGSFDQLHSPKMWIDDDDYSDAGTPSANYFGQTNETRMFFMREEDSEMYDSDGTNNQGHIHAGWVLNPISALQEIGDFDILATDDVLRLFATNTTSTGQDTNSVGVYSGPVTSGSERAHILDSTFSGEDNTQTDWSEVHRYKSGNKLDMTQGGNTIPESDETTWIHGTYSYPNNALDGWAITVNCGENPNEVATVEMTWNFEWTEIS